MSNIYRVVDLERCSKDENYLSRNLGYSRSDHTLCIKLPDGNWFPISGDAKQFKLTAGTNIDITNNVISSNQPTAINPYALSFGDEDYNGSAPKLITAEKIGAATEDFVNSSIATNTAFFKGTFNSVSALPNMSR